MLSKPCSAKKWKSNDFQDAYDVIDENAACAYNQMYRARRTTPSFPRTADVEMALFGLSMMVWPFRQDASPVRRCGFHTIWQSARASPS